ncbi:hypothetical protein B0H19DRAFT_1179937 [Mycena capillaripes]|nr:hypothetical protein B0H19DRAFT_1179937 [Mycena capillaripes]
MSEAERHLARMAAAQHVFSIIPQQSPLEERPFLSQPVVIPNDVILDKFWRRVAGLTTRYHDRNNIWTGSPEIREWNKTNRAACFKCANSKTSRVCIIDEDQLSCTACRSIKIGCDRKPRFVFEMTKEEFFPTFDQFMAIFQNKERGNLQRYIRVPSGGPRCARTSTTTDTNVAPAANAIRAQSTTVHDDIISQGTKNHILSLTEQLIKYATLLASTGDHLRGGNSGTQRSISHQLLRISNEIRASLEKSID